MATDNMNNEHSAQALRIFSRNFQRHLCGWMAKRKRLTHSRVIYWICNMIGHFNIIYYIRLDTIFLYLKWLTILPTLLILFLVRFNLTYRRNSFIFATHFIHSPPTVISFTQRSFVPQYRTIIQIWIISNAYASYAAAK